MTKPMGERGRQGAAPLGGEREGCYICEPEQHQHDDAECMGCDQGCIDCFGDFITWAEGAPGDGLVIRECR